MNSVSAPKIPLDAFDSSRCSVTANLSSSVGASGTLRHTWSIGPRSQPDPRPSDAS